MPHTFKKMEETVCPVWSDLLGTDFDTVSQALHLPLHSAGFAGWLGSVSADGGSVLDCLLVLNSALCYLDSPSPRLSCFLASCSAESPQVALPLLKLERPSRRDSS